MTEGLAASRACSSRARNSMSCLRRLSPIERRRRQPADVQDRLTWIEDAIEASVNASIERGVFLGLPGLATRFGLSPLERQAVLVCLAPELDRKYDTLYAYLQQDITRKRPSADLVWTWQACPSASGGRRVRSCPIKALCSAPRSWRRWTTPRSPSGSSGLARFLKLSERVPRLPAGQWRSRRTARRFRPPASPRPVARRGLDRAVDQG